MIRFLLISALFAFSLGTNAQSKKLLRTYGITSMTETTVKYEDGVEVSRYVSEKEIFDKDGEWIEKFDYTEEGEIKTYESRVYHKGEVIEEVEDKRIVKNNDKPEYSRTQFTYDKDELKKETDLDAEGNVLRIKSYFYNNFEDVSEVTIVDGQDVLQEKLVYIYDDRGLRIEKKRLDSEGELVETKLYAYE